MYPFLIPSHILIGYNQIGFCNSRSCSKLRLLVVNGELAFSTSAFGELVRISKESIFCVALVWQCLFDYKTDEELTLILFVLWFVYLTLK